jgi:uncharacterized protein YjiS (DUF1127 family)
MFRIVQRRFRRAVTAIRRHNDYRALQKLDDRMLKDIGLNRANLRATALRRSHPIGARSDRTIAGRPR